MELPIKEIYAFMMAYMPHTPNTDLLSSTLFRVCKILMPKGRELGASPQILIGK